MKTFVESSKEKKPKRWYKVDGEMKYLIEPTSKWQYWYDIDEVGRKTLLAIKRLE